MAARTTAGLDDGAILAHRLRQHRLLETPFATAAEVVGWMGAVQAQDYPAAKWALGLRTTGANDAGIERAFDEGSILRTHVLRPTWHFVTPADLRWLISLSGPRVLAMAASGFRRLELDARTLAKTRAVIARGLSGQRHLTRRELAAALQKARIGTDGQRLAYVMFDAELSGLVCSGPRRGKQFTYALVEERVPRAPTLTRDESLAELARRYFVSHGPATARDFSWWSGLTMADVRTAVHLAGPALESSAGATAAYWSAPLETLRPRRAASSQLLPCYDEYLVGYRDRQAAAPGRTGIDLLALPQVLIDGRVLASWKAAPAPGGSRAVHAAVPPLTAAQARALSVATARYARFVAR